MVDHYCDSYITEPVNHAYLACMYIAGSRKGVVSGKTLREVELKLFFLLVWSREYCHDILPLQRVIDLEHGKWNSNVVFIDNTQYRMEDGVIAIFGIYNLLISGP